jgi:endonuclease/exonuclease/phosphatase family metal-dependent hydrolase
VRVVTFNVLHGMSPRDGRVDGDRYAAAVRALDADVLGLQEVDLAQPRSGHLDLTGLAAGALGAGSARFVAALDGTPGERFTPSVDGGRADGGPCFGVALVSRLPVRSWHVTRFRPAPVRAPVFVPGPTGPLMLLRDEPRVLLAAVLDGPAGPLTVATTHLSFVPGWNVGQLRRVVRALRGLPGPRLLLGDLNMPGRLARAASGWRSLARVPTYPTGRPRVQLDHVLTDAPGAWHVLAAGAPESAVSDHRPLVVDLDRRGSPR